MVAGGMAASCAAILLSTSATWMSALFKRASSSPVTSRFAGSGIILAEGAIGRVARRFEIATERIAHLIPPFSGFPGGSIRSRDGAWTDDTN